MRHSKTNKIFMHIVGLLFILSLNIKSEVFLGTEYYEDGKIKSRIQIKNGKDLILEKYDENRNLTKTEKRIANETIKSLYPNKTVFEEINYKNGKLNGTYKKYYENGNVMISAYYYDGLLEGEYSEYYPDGTTSAVSQYKNGKLNGIKKNFIQTGK